MKYATTSGWVITARDHPCCVFLTDEIVNDLSGLIVATNLRIENGRKEPQLAPLDAEPCYDSNTVVYTPLDPTDLGGSYYLCTRRRLEEIYVRLPIHDEVRCKEIYAKYNRVRPYVPGSFDYGMRKIYFFTTIHPYRVLAQKGDAVIHGVLVVNGND